jgi:hypothetical protein
MSASECLTAPARNAACTGGGNDRVGHRSAMRSRKMPCNSFNVVRAPAATLKTCPIADASDVVAASRFAVTTLST